MCDHWIGWYYDIDGHQDILSQSKYDSMPESHQEDVCVRAFRFCPCCGQELER